MAYRRDLRSGTGRVQFGDGHTKLVDALALRFPDAVIEEDAAGLAATIEALAALVDHPEHRPDLALDPHGSDYERRVWDALREIPAGQTVSYGDIAAKLGAPREAREVAEACAANAIAILIPCHRVVEGRLAVRLPLGLHAQTHIVGA